MNAIVHKVIEFLVENKIINTDEDTIAFYTYGIEITLSSLLNVTVILFIGILFGKVLNSVVFLIAFIRLRKFTGGFHASSYFRCNLSLGICYLILCIIIKFTIQLNLATLFFISALTGIFSVTVITLFSPIENENKPLDDKTKSTSRRKSIIFSIGLLLLNMIVLLFKIKTIIIALTVFLVAVLMVIKLVKEGKR